MEQIPVGRVQLDDLKPRLDRSAGGGGKCRNQVLDVLFVQGAGQRSPSSKGIGLGPTTDQPPSSAVLKLAPPSQGGRRLALRPA